MEYTKKHRDVLRCLLSGNKRFSDLKKALQYNDMTLTRQLKSLETIKYISHNHVNKTYKITSKGLTFLNQIDIETIGMLFANVAFIQVDKFLDYYFIFDSRIPVGDFNILLKRTIELDMQIPSQSPREMYSDIESKYDSVLLNKKLPKIASTELVLRNEFFFMLSQILSDLILYITIKSIEDNNPAALTFMAALPKMLASRITQYNLNSNQFKKHITTWAPLDVWYQTSKKLTPEVYKQIVNRMGGSFDYLDYPPLKT